MRSTTFRSLGFLMAGIFSLWVPQVFASGFVKGSGGHYSKIGFSSTREKRTHQPISEIWQPGTGDVSQALSFYGEYGLGIFPLKSHVELSAPIKHVKRRSLNPEISDSLATQGFGDSSIQWKAEIFSTPLGSSGVAFFSSAKIGADLPTTKSKYRTENVSQRLQEVPSGREELVAPLADGKFKPKVQLGASFTRSSVWVSSFGQYVAASKKDGRETNFGVDIGTGLPLQSWFQVGFNYNSKHFGGGGRISDSQISSGLGATFFSMEGIGALALEGGFARNFAGKGQTFLSYNSWNAGMSFRSL
jgi:hypothetical protein